ncbi:chaperonin 10-like protein [Bombardia bombarda]|uniref:Chaperonin 10-like protein n=1 Tax=Bombardia bombarda TaxID=252184 RepID=A0AA40C841_9PEZI|nr:chaperonin 10-like protein [Bombardia bombarda]
MSSTLPSTIPSTHPAVAITTVGGPLELIPRPTEAPGPGEVLIHVQWTGSTPLDAHQAVGGLLITPENTPCVMGDAYGGTVVALGPSDPTTPQTLKVGDAVFGYAHRFPREKAHQTYITTDAYMVSNLPPNTTLPEAVTLPTNIVTAFHTISSDLQLPLPWPVPESYQPAEATTPILVWGAASSVGMFSLQVLRHWGYRHVYAVASGKHHATLRALGAAVCFDYTRPDVVEQIVAYATQESSKGSDGKRPKIPFVIDCIGSINGTLRPLTKIAERGTRIAVMLPVIKKHMSKDGLPETHGYLQNTFFRDHLQTEIIPTLLGQGILKPNTRRVVEGKTLLERAQNALDLLREGAPSGEKLVWRVAEADE